MKIAIRSLFLLFLLAGCQQKNVTLENTSPNEKVKITLTAEKSSLNPWQCELKVKAYSFQEGALKFEIFTGNLDNETVSFDWKDDENCLISFSETDGKARTFHLIATPNQVQMAEV